jgi:hypothetical protein
LHTPDSALTSRLSVLGSMEDRFGEILTEEALDFVAGLHSQFAGRRANLLASAAGATTRSGPLCEIRATLSLLCVKISKASDRFTVA